MKARKKILLGIHCGCRETERSPSCYIQDRSRLKARGNNTPADKGLPARHKGILTTLPALSC